MTIKDDIQKLYEQFVVAYREGNASGTERFRQVSRRYTLIFHDRT